MPSDIPTSAVSQDIDPDRLAGYVYDVKLSYTVEYHVQVTAGPEAWQAIEQAELVSGPGSKDMPSDWDLVHKIVNTERPIWMGDHDAPEAAEWLDEPHVPSEETYWDDSVHFGGDNVE